MKPKIQPMKRWWKFAFFENVSKHVRTCVPVSTGFGLWHQQVKKTLEVAQYSSVLWPHPPRQASCGSSDSMDAPTQSLGDVFIGFSDFCLQMVPEVCWIVSNIQKLGSFRDAESSENFHFFFYPWKKMDTKKPSWNHPKSFQTKLWGPGCVEVMTREEVRFVPPNCSLQPSWNRNFVRNFFPLDSGPSRFL